MPASTPDARQRMQDAYAWHSRLPVRQVPPATPERWQSQKEAEIHGRPNPSRVRRRSLCPNRHPARRRPFRRAQHHCQTAGATPCSSRRAISSRLSAVSNTRMRPPNQRSSMLVGRSYRATISAIASAARWTSGESRSSPSDEALSFSVRLTAGRPGRLSVHSSVISSFARVDEATSPSARAAPALTPRAIEAAPEPPGMDQAAPPSGVTRDPPQAVASPALFHD